MIREGNYILIPAFARSQLDLKGNELLLYSLIYGFSQDGKSDFTGSISYMCDWLGASKPTVLKAVKSLIEKGLIDRTETNIGQVAMIRYRAIVPDVQNFTGGKETLLGGKETLPGGKETLRGGKETLPNNIEYTSNNINNNIESGVDEKRKRFVPPTLEEVKAYCDERNNGVDAQHWHDYYSSNGWRVGKNPMKDWKSAVRTWERNEYSSRAPAQQKKVPTFNQFDQREYDYESLQKVLGG